MNDFEIEVTKVEAPSRQLSGGWHMQSTLSLKVPVLTRWQKVKRWLYDHIIPGWAWPRDPEATKPYLVHPDNCEVCLGASGGVRGNENIVDDVVTCDYCDSAGRRLNMVPTHG